MSCTRRILEGGHSMPRILVADDTPELRTVMRKMLETKGYTVIEAANGQEAVDAFQKQPIDVVVMDIIMPEKDGFDAILELRRINPRVSIIAISGGALIAGSKYLAITQMLGVQDVLSKPFRPEDLLNAVGKCLKGPEK